MSAVASKEMSRLHDLMCVEALEGGLDVMQRREFATLSKNLPEVNVSYYWEALGAADLALYGASLVPPSDARKAWVQEASAHFGWSEPEALLPLKAPKATNSRIAQVLLAPADPLDETIAVGFASGAEDDDDGDLDFAGNLHEDASPSLEPDIEPLDETVLSWDERAIDVDQYASDRGLHETVAVAQRTGNALGWWVLTILALLLAAGFAYRAQLTDLANSYGLLPQDVLQGDPAELRLEVGRAVIGGFIWDEVRQQGRLTVDAMPASVDSQRQLQVWLVDAGRDGAAIPVALLRTNTVAHQLDVRSSVLVKQYSGLLISSEPLGGALVPSPGAIIARVALAPE